MKAKTDMEIIDRLLSSDFFKTGVTVTHLEIKAIPSVSICKRLINFINDMTDSDYYLCNHDKALVIPRISPTE